MSSNDSWLASVETLVSVFAEEHSYTFSKKSRELSASFEIGCFHALLNYYEKVGFELSVENLTTDNEFRYLTTPNGNPDNFSFVVAKIGQSEYEIRQQLKIYSNIDEMISFAPDLSVVKRNVTIEKVKDKDFANGKRAFYRVSSLDVIAAHECKSMPPFPELMISFVGMYITAHTWHSDEEPTVVHDKEGLHLAPTMFVGGHAKAMHLKMIQAMERAYPINIVVGMHEGVWNLYKDNRKLNKLHVIDEDHSTLGGNWLASFLNPPELIIEQTVQK
ncbi:hypothetical protein [Photobacterium leiognathi]|uniref:hypothetical protein n=1 Tax=Photobacterium leiognathi TaxID=553611 RepID=UPI00273A0C70|nr:hypothetical protein [Photobacterium leiognathi]